MVEQQRLEMPHLSLPKRGPKCKIGYYKVFNYILKQYCGHFFG
jgi:hypothetical protein